MDRTRWTMIAAMCGGVALAGAGCERDREEREPTAGAPRVVEPAEPTEPGTMTPVGEENTDRPTGQMDQTGQMGQSGTAMGAQQPGTASGTATPATGEQAAQPQGQGQDPDLGILTITVVDIDTKLAAMCGIQDSHIFFKVDSAKVTDDSKQRLEQLASCVKDGAAKGKELAIIGHTDPQGSDAYNKQLGKSRAENVAEQLKQHGVAKARVETTSKGEARASEDPWHWPLDRRVTIRLAE